jgi:DNA-binding LytR/AlgR family response regulator
MHALPARISHARSVLLQCAVRCKLSASMNIRRPVFFSILFWLLAAGVLFVNAWSNAKNHFDVAFVRYAYFVVVGLLASGVMMAIFASDWFSRQNHRLIWVTLFSVIAAFITAILINPITYMMAGHDIRAVPIEIVSTGMLYFALLFVIWSALYLQLKGESILLMPPAATAEPRTPLTFQVEKQGEIRQLRASDIVCVLANGDYIDLVTAANRYLKKDTMSNIEALLDPGHFKRIHRSAIVNITRIESVSPKPGGTFEIALEGGHHVQSSRSYRSVVESIAPSG